MILQAPEFILYVKDQPAARDFYAAALGLAPVLDVPGMTEFVLGSGCKLGLMPENGIAKIISPALPHPSGAGGIPRCELYLLVDAAEKYMERAMHAGARLVSPLAPRDWGHAAGYVADADGHVIAFAENR